MQSSLLFNFLRYLHDFISQTYTAINESRLTQKKKRYTVESTGCRCWVPLLAWTCQLSGPTIKVLCSYSLFCVPFPPASVTSSMRVRVQDCEVKPSNDFGCDGRDRCCVASVSKDLDAKECSAEGCKITKKCKNIFDPCREFRYEWDCESQTSCGWQPEKDMSTDSQLSFVFLFIHCIMCSFSVVFSASY